MSTTSGYRSPGTDAKHQICFVFVQYATFTPFGVRKTQQGRILAWSRRQTKVAYFRSPQFLYRRFFRPPISKYGVGDEITTEKHIMLPTCLILLQVCRLHLATLGKHSFIGRRVACAAAGATSEQRFFILFFLRFRCGSTFRRSDLTVLATGVAFAELATSELNF